MSVQPAHLGLVAAGPTRLWNGAPATARPAPDAPASVDGARLDVATIVEASPPPAVQQEVAAAAERTRQMAADNRELHFAKDPTSGRIVVEVRDLDGNVLRVIPPSEALDLMTGHGSVR